jgi:hypothetical protein
LELSRQNDLFQFLLLADADPVPRSVGSSGYSKFLDHLALAEGSARNSAVVGSLVKDQLEIEIVEEGLLLIVSIDVSH